VSGGLTVRRRALVTGAARASGLGRAIAVRLAEEGADVVVGYRGERDGANAVVAQIEAAGGRAIAMQADLLDPEECRGLVASAASDLGGLDVFVNNAGANHVAPFLELTAEQWDRDVAINMSAFFHCGQTAAKLMVEQGTGGSIALVSSSSAALVGPQIAQYGAAKAGAETLARYMAYELAPHGINVNAIAPGPAGPTDLNRPFVGDPADRAATERNIPMGRLASPQDVAGAVAFAVSPGNSYVTGTRIAVDGGFTVGKDQTA
jgi:NAD(P)-dependent dehydrogenase (short-subunit alcohol dehydrogenase family)